MSRKIKNATEFGKLLRKIRVQNSENGKDMAKKLGMTNGYLSAIELGNRNIPGDMPRKVSELYNYNIIELNETYNKSTFKKNLQLDLSKLEDDVATDLMDIIIMLKDFDFENIIEVKKIIIERCYKSNGK